MRPYLKYRHCAESCKILQIQAYLQIDLIDRNCARVQANLPGESWPRFLRSNVPSNRRLWWDIPARCEATQLAYLNHWQDRGKNRQAIEWIRQDSSRTSQSYNRTNCLPNLFQPCALLQWEHFLPQEWTIQFAHPTKVPQLVLLAQHWIHAIRAHLARGWNQIPEAMPTGTMTKVVVNAKSESIFTRKFSFKSLPFESKSLH